MVPTTGAADRPRSILSCRVAPCPICAGKNSFNKITPRIKVNVKVGKVCPPLKETETVNLRENHSECRLSCHVLLIGGNGPDFVFSSNSHGQINWERSGWSQAKNHGGMTCPSWIGLILLNWTDHILSRWHFPPNPESMSFSLPVVLGITWVSPCNTTFTNPCWQVRRKGSHCPTTSRWIHCNLLWPNNVGTEKWTYTNYQVA